MRYIGGWFEWGRCRVFEPVPYAESSGELRVLYDEIAGNLQMSGPPNWALYLGARVDVLRAFAATIAQLTANSLSPLLTQLLLVSVSYSNRAMYCLQYHGHKVMRLVPELTWDELMEICEGRSRAVIPDSYEVAVAIAIALSREQCALGADGVAALQEAGYRRDEIQDIVYAISFGQLFNTFTMIADVPIDEDHRVPGFSSPAAC